MNLLTNDECRDIYNSAMTLPDRSAVSVTRAIEAAVIKKLAAGVSVEPVANISASSNGCIGFVKPDKYYYALAQLQTAIAAARVQAIRDALNCYSPDDTETDWADKIRALIGGQQT